VTFNGRKTAQTRHDDFVMPDLNGHRLFTHQELTGFFTPFGVQNDKMRFAYSG
jgi:hypothetical protein